VFQSQMARANKACPEMDILVDWLSFVNQSDVKNRDNQRISDSGRREKYRGRRGGEGVESEEREREERGKGEEGGRGMEKWRR